MIIKTVQVINNPKLKKNNFHGKFVTFSPKIVNHE